MPILTINISIDVDVNYFENQSDLTDDQIVSKVYELVEAERNALAMEVRIAAIGLFDNDDGSEDKDLPLRPSDRKVLTR